MEFLRLKITHFMTKRRKRMVSMVGGVLALTLLLIRLLPSAPPAQPRTWQEITASGTLRVTTEYNTVGYYVEGDSLSGFHYELVQLIAKELGLKAEITPEMSLEKQLDGIHNGTFDVIASGLLLTSEYKDSLIAYTTPLYVNRQVLVQRAEQPDDTLTDKLFVKNLFELANRTVYVPQGSPALYRIQNLSQEMGDSIHVKEVPKYGPEQLMAMVAHRDIDYAICESSIAKKLIKELPELDARQEVSFNQFYAWGINAASVDVLAPINALLTRLKKTEAYQALLKKYHLEEPIR